MKYGIYAAGVSGFEISGGTTKEDCAAFCTVMGEVTAGQAAQATDTAILAYKILSRKDFYIRARAHLIMQQLKNVHKLFRKTHLVYACSILCFSKTAWWAGSLGDVKLYSYTDTLELLLPLSKERPVGQRLIEDSIGLPIKRNQGHYKREQWFIILTKSVLTAINEKQLETLLNTAKTEKRSLEESAKQIIGVATKHRKQDNYAAAIFERDS